MPGDSGHDEWEKVSVLFSPSFNFYKSRIADTYDRVEGAVKQILCGLNVKTSASVANAECLDWYREWAQKN